MQTYVVVTAWDNTYGPFASEDDAIKWAKGKGNLTKWYVKPLIEPR